MHMLSNLEMRDFQASSSNPYLPSMAQRRSDDSVHTTSEHGSIGLGRPSYTDAFGGSATSGGLSGLASKRASSASGSPSLFASATGSGSMSPTFGATASPSALRAASSTTSTPPSHSPGIMTGAGQGSNRISPSTLHPNIANGGDPLYAQRQQFQAPNRASSPFMGEGGYGIPGHHTPQRPLSRNLSRGSHHGSEFSHRQQGMESRTQLFVGNVSLPHRRYAVSRAELHMPRYQLPFRVRWQDLKDLFRKCGTVLRSDVALTLDRYDHLSCEYSAIADKAQCSVGAKALALCSFRMSKTHTEQSRCTMAIPGSLACWMCGSINKIRMGASPWRTLQHNRLSKPRSILITLRCRIWQI